VNAWHGGTVTHLLPTNSWLSIGCVGRVTVPPWHCHLAVTWHGHAHHWAAACWQGAWAVVMVNTKLLISVWLAYSADIDTGCALSDNGYQMGGTRRLACARVSAVQCIGWRKNQRLFPWCRICHHGKTLGGHLRALRQPGKFKLQFATGLILLPRSTREFSLDLGLAQGRHLVSQSSPTADQSRPSSKRKIHVHDKSHRCSLTCHCGCPKRPQLLLMTQAQAARPCR
jgi:hypothetical protein